MDLCEICPGAGGGRVEGICSGCGRKACSNHLITQAGPDPSLSEIGTGKPVYVLWAAYPHGVNRVSLIHETHGFSEPAAHAYLDAWAGGTNLCVECRYADARGAAGKIQREEADRAAQAARVLEEFRTCHDAERLMDLIVAGLEAPEVEWMRAWTVLCPLWGPPTHEVVQLTATGMFGTGRPRESPRIPVWEVPDAIMHGVFTHDDDQEPSWWEQQPAYLAADGVAWWGKSGWAIIVKDSSRRALLRHGAVPKVVKHRVLHVVNATDVQTTIATIDPLGRIVTDAVRLRRSLPLTPHPGRK